MVNLVSGKETVIRSSYCLASDLLASKAIKYFITIVLRWRALGLYGKSREERSPNEDEDTNGKKEPYEFSGHS